MLFIIPASLVGVIAGLCAMVAPAAVSWAASFGFLGLDESWLAFLGYRFTPWVLTLLALIELVTDQLPSTPSSSPPGSLWEHSREAPLEPRADLL
jgi:uncharacterized membrane protein